MNCCAGSICVPSCHSLNVVTLIHSEPAEIAACHMASYRAPFSRSTNSCPVATASWLSKPGLTLGLQMIFAERQSDTRVAKSAGDARASYV